MEQLEQMTVIEGVSIRKYSLQRTTSGHPYYMHPFPVHDDPKLKGRPDYMFFPKLKDRFRVYPKRTRVGFRFVVGESSEVTIDLSGITDNPPPAIKQLILVFGIQRVEYHAKAKDLIVVSRVGASLVPPRDITIRGGADEVGKMADMIIDEILDLHCDWYGNHNI